MRDVRRIVSVTLAGLVVLLLWALPGLAYATPPDPTWLPGLWDDGDYDDVVVLVTSDTVSLTPALSLDVRPALPVVGRTPPSPAAVAPSRPASVVRLRSPPIA